jgi:hypothetical protein
VNSIGIWRFATIGAVGTCAVLVAAIVQLDLVSSATTANGTNVVQVKTVRSASPAINNGQDSSPTFIDVPGARTTITVPQGQNALIVARFTAESECDDDNALQPDTRCYLRILIGSTEGAPASGLDLIFDNNGRGQDLNDTPEARAWRGLVRWGQDPTWSRCSSQ